MCECVDSYKVVASRHELVCSRCGIVVDENFASKLNFNESTRGDRRDSLPTAYVQAQKYCDRVNYGGYGLTGRMKRLHEYVELTFDEKNLADEVVAFVQRLMRAQFSLPRSDAVVAIALVTILKRQRTGGTGRIMCNNKRIVTQVAALMKRIKRYAPEIIDVPCSSLDRIVLQMAAPLWPKRRRHAVQIARANIHLAEGRSPNEVAVNAVHHSIHCKRLPKHFKETVPKDWPDSVLPLKCLCKGDQI